MTKWKEPRGDERTRHLAERQKLKMARNAHAYVRGSTARFYEWLEGGASHAVPSGPAVWICGDCHIGNLGPVANAAGKVEVELRDFDQAVIGNPAHDLVRLCLSLAMAARGSDLPGVTTAKMLEAAMRGYEAAMLGEVHDSDQWKRKPAAVRFVLKQAVRRSWRHLFLERLDDLEPTIPRNSRFWSIDGKERAEVETLLQHEGVRRLVTALRVRDDDAKVTLLDVAYWVKGCSSLGRLRLAALVSVAGKRADVKRGDLCLVDMKEAIKPLAPPYPRANMPKDEALRVVMAARALAPFLGERMIAAHLFGRSVFLRELLPQDLKIEIDQLDQLQATQVAGFLATVVGRAHARQLDDAARKAWCATLRRSTSKSLDAPSWLWRSVVDLVSVHEAAYLEHCRRYAMEADEAKQKSA
jgi:uncharacterized protein (DUF2252 family)